MSHSIDGGRDNFDDDDFSRAPRARRARRVIVDDNYDGDFADQSPRAAGPSFGGADESFGRSDPDERFAPEPTRRRVADRDPSRAVVPREPRNAAPNERRAARGAGAEREEAGRGVFMSAFVAMLVWVGGVGAFAFGYVKTLAAAAGVAAPSLLADPIGALGWFLQSPSHILLMTGAIAIAPVGLVWLWASTARRAQALAAAAERLSAAANGDGASRGGADFSGASASVADLEESFAHLEERIAAAREETEREAASISAMVQSINGESQRFAAEVADQIAARIGSGGGAPAAPASSFRDPAPTPSSFATEADEPRPRPTPGSSDAIARAAEAALGALGGAPAPKPTAAEPDEHSSRLDSLRRRLEGPAESSLRRDPAEPAGFESSTSFDAGFEDFDTPEGSELDAPTASTPAVERDQRPVGGGELDWAKLVRAANFPDSEDDRETLDALYAVLTDKEAASLLQTAEDALSALADIDLYMEDLQPHHAPAELWRAYIVDGVRKDIIDLGGIRDPHAIEDVASAFERNRDFEQSAQRFMDRYESMLDRLFAEAPSAKLAVELANTRSGRAFMLLARAAGRFG
ncbi:MAG: hypothetical protein MRY74_08895 [Neomegalonema sp.]|nr:hypothetical protein [Neomegalonema sp.]